MNERKMVRLSCDPLHKTSDHQSRRFSQCTRAMIRLPASHLKHWTPRTCGNGLEQGWDCAEDMAIPPV